MPPNALLGRRPGKHSTKPIILNAAREPFAERGFERTTIRAVAARSGVDPATVLHHFETKEHLLDAALELPIDPRALVKLIAENPGREGEALLTGVLALWEAPATRLQLIALLRIGTSHERAATAVRQLFTREVIGPLASQLTGPDADLRAGLAATQIAGLALLRFIISIAPVAQADPTTLVELVGPTIQGYISPTTP